jgi:hypothetical protein
MHLYICIADKDFDEAIESDATKVEWNIASINKKPPEWGLCQERTGTLITKLLPDGITIQNAKEYFDANFICSELYGINFNVLKSFNYFCRPN